jgi:hypothetical protein
MASERLAETVITVPVVGCPALETTRMTINEHMPRRLAFQANAINCASGARTLEATLDGRAAICSYALACRQRDQQ